jgi:hypothetical protein
MKINVKPSQFGDEHDRLLKEIDQLMLEPPSEERTNKLARVAEQLKEFWTKYKNDHK